MQVIIKLGKKGKPRTFEITRVKANLLIKFAEFLSDDNSPLMSYEDGKKEFERIKKSIESGLIDAKNIISGKKQGKLLSDLLNEE
jgi:hypothetical protein